jgi:phosphohistidine phosphatase
VLSNEPFGMQRSLRGDEVGPVSSGRRLVILRHAKAEPFAQTDLARQLTARGRASAHDVGRHLQEAGFVPDVALVSTAVRTRETWAEVAEGCGASATEVRFEDALFSGSADAALDALRAAPEDASTVLYVGHNPTAEYFCHLLDDGEGDPAAVSGLLHGFPPGALAVLEVSVPWADLAPETGRVVDYYVGRS